MNLSPALVQRIDNDHSLKQNEQDERSNHHLNIFMQGNHVIFTQSQNYLVWIINSKIEDTVQM